MSKMERALRNIVIFLAFICACVMYFFSREFWGDVLKKKYKVGDEVPIKEASDKTIKDFSYGMGNCCVKTKGGCTVVVPSSMVKGWGQQHKDSVVVKPAFKTHEELVEGSPKDSKTIVEEDEFHIDEEMLRRLIDKNKKKNESVREDATNSNN